MMSYLKGAVTGLKTSRFKDNEFDLDLTYVTDRIIAMSFPGSGISSIFRNPLTDVAKMLHKHHGNNYMVINLSGNPYDYKKFNNQVCDFPWEDHHSPPISLLYEACKRIHDFLEENDKNVVAVHCMAGKGRTGTLIVSYLLYSGRFETSDQALEYYKKKRFVENGGVTQPSQVRSVKYFEKVFNSYLCLNKLIDPVVVQIEKVTLHGVPTFNSGAFKPVIKLYAVNDKNCLYNSEVMGKPVEYNAMDHSKVDIPFGSKSPILTGDILVKVYHDSSYSQKKAFRFAFNTSFIETNPSMKSVLRLTLDNLDPYELKKDDRFPLSFTVDVHMKILVNGANFEDPESKMYVEYYEKDANQWQKIYTILKDYKAPSKEASTRLLFDSPENDDVDKVLNIKKEKIDRLEPDWDILEEQ